MKPLLVLSALLLTALALTACSPAAYGGHAFATMPPTHTAPSTAPAAPGYTMPTPGLMAP